MIKVKKQRYYILFLFTLAGIASHAQPYASRLGRFQVDQKKGCVPFTITLTNLLPGDCTAGKPCEMDYEGNNTQQQNVFTFTYTKAGTFKLSVLYQSIGTDDITITVDPNVQPNFEMYACAGNKAAIKVVDNNYDQYVIDFNNDGVAESILPYSNNILSPSYSYSPAGKYTASVRGRRLNSSDNCTAKQQTFQTIASIVSPQINTLTSVDNTSVKLDFTITANIQYKLEIAVNGSSTFQPLQTLFAVNTTNVPNLKLDDNYYCFRLGAYDPCNNVTSYSTIVCSTKFTATAISDINQLRWPTGATQFVSSTSIARNKTSYFTLTGTGQSFDDTGIICKTAYCYQVTVNYLGGGKSISLEKCVNSFSAKIPTAIGDVSSVVSTSGVDLNWKQDPKFVPREYLVLRSFPGSPLTFIGSADAASPKYIDNSYQIEGKYCYQVNYTDKCDNISPPGTVACPMRLSGTLEKSNAIILVWNSSRGWKNGVKNYLVEKYNLQGTLIKSTTVTDTTFVDDQPDPNNQLVRYDVKALSNDAGLTNSISNTVEIIKNANLYYPTAFTPNGDNLNDGFIVSGQYIVKINLKIFDRWGALLYASDKNEPWDGHRDGKPLPASTYVWKVEITDLAGRSFSQEGTVALIRN